MQTKLQLSSLKKGSDSISTYFRHAKSLVDTMVATSHPLPNYEFFPHLLAGLDLAYDPMVSSIITHLDLISPSKLLGHLLAHEARLLSHSENNEFSTNYTSKPYSSSSQKSPFSPQGCGTSGNHSNYCGRKRSSCGNGPFTNSSTPSFSTPFDSLLIC